MLDQQVGMGWPGLGEEVRKVCKDIGLPDITGKAVTTTKEAIKEAVKYNHLKHLKLSMNQKGVKLKKMAQTDMSARREYLQWSVEEARMGLRLESYMFDCRVNMPAKYGRDLKCRACLPAGPPGPDDLAQHPAEPVVELRKGGRGLL